MSKPVHVTEQNFAAEVLQADLPVLVDFWAAWCGPCRMVAPVVEDLATEYEGVVKVGKVDVDENAGLAERYNIQSIPTLALFRDGRLIARVLGYVPKAELKRQIETALRARATAA